MEYKIKIIVLLSIGFFWQSCIKGDFKVIFMIDKDYDKMAIYYMFKNEDPAGLLSRSSSMQIDYAFAKEIKKSKTFEEISSKLTYLVDDRYIQRDEEIKKSIKEYENSWKDIIDDFSYQIQKITEEKWFYPEYQCVVSPFHPGLSNWYGNKIVRKSGENPTNQRRITAHEIVLSHVFQICRKYYNKTVIDDWKVWRISEITTVFILDNPNLLKYWGNYQLQDNYFSQSNYPQLADAEKKLKAIYAKRKSFKDYIDQAVVYVNS